MIFTILIYDQGMTGLYFLYLCEFNIKCRFNRWFFRCNDDDLIISIIVSRPDACRVSRYKRCPVTSNASQP